MARPDSCETQKDGREAVLSLHNALAAYRQHPSAPEIWRPAQRRAVAAVQKATQDQAFVLGLRAGAVYVADEAVLPFAPGDRPFGRLRAAGIGELVLAQGLSAERTEQLLRQLTAMAGSDGVDGELTALIDTAHIPGVNLRAAADLGPMRSEQATDWSALPAVMTTSADLQAMIERDVACNLPALAARQLLDDAEHSPHDCSQILQRLMTRLLAADDLATITWLLTECERRPFFDRATRAQLLAMARLHCSVEWLQAMLDRGTTEELLQLSALVMQLGDDVAESFATAAAAVAHPLSQWLGELLGHPRQDTTHQNATRKR